MGYLPIVLALLGFTFLWAIVNYNSLKSKKAEVEQAALQVFKYASLRNAIIKRMANISHEDNTLQQTVVKVRDQLNEQDPEAIRTTEKIEAEKKISQMVSDIPAGYKKDSLYSEAYKQLQVVQNSYKKAASVYLIRREEYHELLRRQPSKLIAHIFGFKPIESDGAKHHA